MIREERTSTRGKVLFVVPRFHTNLAHAVRILVENGFDPAIFASSQSESEDHRYAVPQVFGPSTRRDRIREALCAFDPDLILLRKTPPLSQHVARLSAFGRYNVVSYDLRPLDKPRPKSRLLAHRLTGRPVRRVTPVPGLRSGAQRDLFASLLPWPVDRIDQPRRPRDPVRPLRVLCVAKLKQPRKNHLLLVEALKGALADGRATLTLVGSSASLPKVGAGTEPYFATLQAAAHENPEVRIVADVPYPDMPEVYRSHDVCVLPSREEPLGMAPLEAMAYGCVPLISTDCGSAGYIQSGQNGWLFEPNDAAQLAAQLDGLSRDTLLLDRMSDGALETARGQLGRQAFLAGIERLLGRRRSGPV